MKEYGNAERFIRNSRDQIYVSKWKNSFWTLQMWFNQKETKRSRKQRILMRVTMKLEMRRKMNSKMIMMMRTIWSIKELPCIKDSKIRRSLCHKISLIINYNNNSISEQILFNYHKSRCFRIIRSPHLQPLTFKRGVALCSKVKARHSANYPRSIVSSNNIPPQ